MPCRVIGAPTVTLQGRGHERGRSDDASHFEGILAWVTSRQTNGFLEAINGLFQAAKRKARGYVRFRTIRTVIFLIAGKLDFSRINPYAAKHHLKFNRPFCCNRSWYQLLQQQAQHGPAGCATSIMKT